MDYRLEQLRFQIREDPSSRIFFKLGEHLRREGELDEAVEILKGGLEQHPTYVAAWVSLGRALIDRGDAAAASETLQRALELDPENAVASRYAGEAAIATGEWVEAIKALKRARAMSPQDETLDERIALVEGELAKMGLLEAPEPAAAPHFGGASAAGPDRAAEAVFDVGRGDDAEGAAKAEDVFAGGEAEEFPLVQPEAEAVASATDADEVFLDADAVAEEGSESFFIDADAVQPEDDGPVFAVAHEPAEAEADPVAWVDDAVAGGDFGRETLQVPLNEMPFPEITDDEVAEVVEDSEVIDPDPDPLPDPDSVPHPEATFEPVFEPDSGEPDDEGPESPFEPVFESEPEPVFEPVVEPGPEAVFESEPEPVPEEVAVGFIAETVPVEPFVSEPLFVSDSDSDSDEVGESPAEALPLPTMTLVRLALEQGDEELAITSLRALIEREPGNDDAIRLLESLQPGSPAEEKPAESPGDPADARARALRGWLEAVRLASEKLKS